MIRIVLLMLCLNVHAQELGLNSDYYTLLPEEDNIYPEEGEMPYVYTQEERIDEIIEIENEPLILRREEDL